MMGLFRYVSKQRVIKQYYRLSDQPEYAPLGIYIYMLHPDSAMLRPFMDKRALAVLIFCLLVIVAIAALVMPRKEVEPELSIVAPPFATTRIATYALENHLVDVSGLPPLKLEYTYDFNEMMLALKGDLGLMSTEAFAKACEQGVPLKIVAAGLIAGNEIGNYLIFTRNSSTFKGPSELAGAKIGIPSPRGLKTCNLVFLEVMEKKFNLTLDISSPLIIDKPLPQLPSLLDAGQFDAALVIGDQAAQLMLQPSKYQLLYDVSSGFKELYGEYPIATVVVVKSTLLESKPTVVKRVLKALNTSWSYGLSHLGDAVSWAVKAGAARSEDETLELLRQSKYRFTLSDPDREGILKVLDLAYEKGLIKVRPDPARIFASLEG
jgi:ABC-type nitrate/sulfonate/bicarbonate transport system substrate-binding protein